MNNKKEILDNEVNRNEDFYRQDHSIINAKDSGIADMLLKNNKLYNSMKGDWSRTELSRNGVTKTTTGRKDGKFFITREQLNIKAIKEGVRRYRELAEAGVPDPLAPIMPDGSLGWKWMDLPDVIAIRISDTYFGGMPWSILKHDKTLKAQFYRVVQQEYPQYVCYPGGKLPIPIEVPYPRKQGEQRFFKGH